MHLNRTNWTRDDTIRRLRADRRGLRISDYAEMIAGIMAVAIVLGMVM